MVSLCIICGRVTIQLELGRRSCLWSVFAKRREARESAVMGLSEHEKISGQIHSRSPKKVPG